MNTKGEQVAIDAFKEMRAGLEINLTTLQAWLRRCSNDEPTADVLRKRIAKGEHALNMITGARHAVALRLLAPIDEDHDHCLIAALEDIKNWDEEMKEQYGTPQNRAAMALDKYSEGLQ